MKRKLAALIIASLSIGAISTVSAADDKNALILDIQTTVKAGTCQTQLQTTAGQNLTTVAFGDVYKPELQSKSKVQNFQLAISKCTGLMDHVADITLEPSGINCAGPTPGASFANAISGGASATAVEVWTGTPDAGGTQFNCAQKNVVSQDVTNAAGSGKVVVPLTARMVIAPTRSLSDVTAGEFSSSAIFVVSYK
ncbi:fimbrial protein [Enterobacter sp. UNJFSC 003]|uniref:fimbrial protein n=1 Tax=Enterobacter sp. UNJFSC 003 TaxID=3122077 RepID=UPI002EA8ECE4|nr:fimbrial protein [Serratia liquefaciens]